MKILGVARAQGQDSYRDVHDEWLVPRLHALGF